MAKSLTPGIPMAQRLAMLRNHVFGFGKYFGQRFSDVPHSYINWVLHNEGKYRQTNCDMMVCAVESIKSWIRGIK